MFERLTLDLVHRISLPVIRAHVQGNVLAFESWPPADEEYVVLVVREPEGFFDVRLIQRALLALLPKANTVGEESEPCEKQFLWSSD